jgi:hypothetical protein
MGGCQATVFVLDQVKGFDQQIASTGHLAKQSGDFCRGVRVNLTALGHSTALAAFSRAAKFKNVGVAISHQVHLSER